MHMVAIVTNLWPIRFEFMASFGILQSLSKPPNPGVGSRTVGEKKIVIPIESDGLCVALDGLKKVTLFCGLHGCGEGEINISDSFSHLP